MTLDAMAAMMSEPMVRKKFLADAVKDFEGEQVTGASFGVG
jgi:hypothetical protein